MDCPTGLPMEELETKIASGMIVVLSDGASSNEGTPQEQLPVPLQKLRSFLLGKISTVYQSRLLLD